MTTDSRLNLVDTVVKERYFLAVGGREILGFDTSPCVGNLNARQILTMVRISIAALDAGVSSAGAALDTAHQTLAEEK